MADKIHHKISLHQVPETDQTKENHRIAAGEANFSSKGWKRVSIPWLLFFVLFSTGLIIERAFSSILLESGARVDEALQDDDEIKIWFLWASEVIYPNWFYSILTILAVFLSVESTYMLFVTASFCQAINGFIKALYAQPRPSYIHSYSLAPCPTSLGMPSGHAMLGIMMYVSLGFIASHAIKEGLRIRNQKKARAIISSFVTIGAIIALMIGTSRLFNGMHTFAQVILGWSWGILFFGIFWSRRAHFQLQCFNKGSRTYWVLRFASWSLLFFAALSILPSVSEWKVPNLWIQNIENHCPGSLKYPVDNPSRKYFRYGAWFETSRVFLLIGADIALLFSQRLAKHFDNFYSERVNYSPLYWLRFDCSGIKTTLKMISHGIILCCVWIGLSFYVPEDLGVGESSSALEIYASESLSKFCMSFIFFSAVAFLPIILYPVDVFGIRDQANHQRVGDVSSRSEEQVQLFIMFL